MNKPEFFKTWIIFFIISTVMAALAAMVVGLILALMLGSGDGENLAQYDWILNLASLAISMPISFLAFRWAVKQFMLRPLCEDANIEIEGISSDEPDFL